MQGLTNTKGRHFITVPMRAGLIRRVKRAARQADKSVAKWARELFDRETKARNDSEQPASTP